MHECQPMTEIPGCVEWNNLFPRHNKGLKQMCIRIKVIEFLAILIMITVDIDDVFLCAIQYNDAYTSSYEQLFL